MEVENVLMHLYEDVFNKYLILFSCMSTQWQN
jgi:hypothetical protein